MGFKKLLLTGAAIAVVVAAAILVPSVATGAPLPVLLPATFAVAPDDGPGENGRGNAFGPDKDSPDFPGNGNRGDGARGGDGRGNAFGHDKDSPDFPGNNGRGNGDADAMDDDGPDHNGDGNAIGHDKDSPDVPGDNGRGHDDSDD
ncbi:hypothetical protein [Microbacterium sp. LWS13-1.2]|uniref:Uncharacterized protein n=1 Tax=Microbacterium sp. LWS13-1.2 TaxID=3135264 RepID=A0AAU6S8L8_9MICO